MQPRNNVPLAPLTTIGIGGTARWFAEADSEDSIIQALRFAHDRQLPLFVLGGGSNVLISDDGFPGLVLHMTLQGITQQDDLFQVAAGDIWDNFVSFAVERGFAGIECLAGIPGTVGGTPIQNVGAYGQEVSETIAAVRVLDLTTAAFIDLPASACSFSYRRSIFNSTESGRYIVTRVDYRLRPGGAPTLSYADLKNRFEKHPGQPSLAEVSAAVREIRRAKGMLIVPGEPDSHSVGSFFRNPVITENHYARLAAQFPIPVPRYPAGPGKVKLPAAWLVEHAGFSKGYVLGKAGISSRHTLALINRGGATAREIIVLRDRIASAVEHQYGIRLVPEPVWIY
ncbi:UDP-N-acetylmuramate dehydrogenase [Paracidobacterium acidisoli]|uniref:UDP-N-acetylenolpyruvoylglucosamine reductase n=1 Tax=Paracidobacterium acidisoli TaxID=2303751 RepID=A0A372IS95_9BACT|nr:UDP-N-acetylmuramate dehydrogenase [Paracidobacterium acidisoli]MBT9330558.1 UDP-N-acetylmuramate dehydrogenase [Paracidobacterium acidisoli]